jgi:hypothetical protein
MAAGKEPLNLDFILLAGTFAMVAAGAVIMMVVLGLTKTKRRQGRVPGADVVVGIVMILVALLFGAMSLAFLGAR